MQNIPLATMSADLIKYRKLCRDGNLPELIEYFDGLFIAADNDALVIENLQIDHIWRPSRHIFGSACEYGHFHIAHYLADRFELTTNYTSGCDNLALEKCCKRGHLKTAQFLVERFGLIYETTEINDAFCVSVRFGHAHVVQFLIEQFEITMDDDVSLINPIYLRQFDWPIGPKSAAKLS